MLSSSKSIIMLILLLFWGGLRRVCRLEAGSTEYTIHLLYAFDFDTMKEEASKNEGKRQLARGGGSSFLRLSCLHSLACCLALLARYLTYFYTSHK